MKKLCKVIIIFIIGILCGYMISNKKASQNQYTCNVYKGEFENIEYIKPNYELLIGKNEIQYFMDITLNFVDNGVVFSGDKAYMLVNLNGLIPYSVLETNNDYVEIPLENKELPSSFSVQLTNDNYTFDEESKHILLDYLNGKRNDEVTVVSICLFAPDGKIIHVANKILEN